MVKVQNQDRKLRLFWREFLLWSFGCFLLYSAYGTLLNMQSSINVVDGLGTFSVTITYATSALVSLLCAPILLRKFGAKKCVCASELTYVAYMLANFYPVFWTMAPTSFILGMGDCIVWSVFAIFNSYFANKYSVLKGTPCNSSRFSGYFYAIFQCAKIFGNLVSFVVLYAFSEATSVENISASASSFKSNTTLLNHVTPNENVASHTNETSNFVREYCGARDCQDPSVVDDTITQYIPSAEIARYSLLSLMLLLCICAFGVHLVFLPNTRGEEFADNTEANDSKCNNFVWIGIKDSFKHLLNVQQLLVMTITFYAGLQYAFIICELTRAFSSCIFGLSMVPIHMSAYGLSACVVAYVIGKFVKSAGRNCLFAFAAIMDIAGYAYCLFVEPDSISSWMLFVVFFTMGGVQGIWIVMTNVLYMVYFPDRLDIAGPMWSVLFICGIAVQFGWSTSLCVAEKIFVHLGVLALSMLTYALAEIRHRKKQGLIIVKIDDNDQNVEENKNEIEHDGLLSNSKRNCSEAIEIA
ncbi:protein unc-93 homolog A-like [Styela clava]